MGVVVQARHIDLNTRFALKFMLPDALKDHENVQRFQREARAAVRLRSEHTARVHDVGHLENGAPFMVMEFLVGQDLGQLVEESGAMPPFAAVEYILQACEAIAEAHAIGIVHRDLKPRNLFLAKRVDGRPLIKVLDFGLAKTLDRTQDHALTRTTAVMGSPQYMSPEQMRASRTVDARTDIWSLGVCLYELVTGVVPFDAPTVPELCALVLKDPPRPPHELRRDIPFPLSMIITRCLEKDASMRFPDVAALAEALERFGSIASQGAASRVRNVLSTTPPVMDSEAPPPPLGASATSLTYDGRYETRTAASFDSRPKKDTRDVSMRWVGAGAATITALAVLVVGIGFGVGARRHTTAPSAEVSRPPPAVDIVPTVPELPTTPPPPVTAGAPAPSASVPPSPPPPAAVPVRTPPRKAVAPPRAIPAPPTTPAPPPPPPTPTPTPPPKKDPGSDF